MKIRKKGTILIIAGLLLLSAALALFCYNLWDARRADTAAQTVVARLEAQLPDTLSDFSTREEVAGENLPILELDGDNYIGLLQVPSLDLTLPVMNDWDYDRLKTAPCRYDGSLTEGNLVIAGHNYARHFSGLKWLPTGSKINFIDLDGNVYHYEVSYIETLKPDEIDRMTADSDDWDLTLFTCTTGGFSRCTLRCVRTDP